MSSRNRNISISSCSEDDLKKRKRMISNRESARRSRMKREQHIKDLNDQISYFTSKSSEILKKSNEVGRRYMAVEAENRILRMHGEELKKRLEFLEKMLDSYSRNNDDDECFMMDILQDPSLKPWLQQQPPFQSQSQTQTVDGI